MHKVSMMVNIPDEEWGAFTEQHDEAGHVQFTYRNSTVFAEIF